MARPRRTFYLYFWVFVKMSSTKFVTSVSLFCCLAGVYFGNSIVRANEPELYFYPEQKWSVERLNPDDASLPICAVSNQLNNGYRVEMSGSAEGFTAINIDFRQSAFKEGKKYEIQYLVPGVSRIVIPSKAVKNSTVASDLTGHLDFAREISNAGVMDIQIRDNAFRLYLTGLKSKMSEYNECTRAADQSIAYNNNVSDGMSGNVAATDMPSDALLDSSASAAPADAPAAYVPAQPKAVAGVAPPPPPMAMPVENAPDMAMDSAAKARPEATDEPRYIDILAAKLKRGSRAFMSPSDDSKAESVAPDNAKDVSSSSDSSDASSASSAADTPEENKASAKTTYKVSHTSKSDKPEKIIRHVIKNEEPIVVDFTEKAEAPATPAPEVQAEVQASATRAAQLSQIEPASNSSVSGQAIDMDAIAQNDEEFVDMRNKISSLEHQVKTLTDENVMLDEELKLALKDAEKERLSVSSDNWNLERATMRFNEAERQIQRLGRQLQTQRAQCELEKTELENMLFDPKLTSQQQLAKLSSMEADLDRAKSEIARQQRQYEERIKLLEQQLGAQ